MIVIILNYEDWILADISAGNYVYRGKYLMIGLLSSDWYFIASPGCNDPHYNLINYSWADSDSSITVDQT